MSECADGTCLHGAQAGEWTRYLKTNGRHLLGQGRSLLLKLGQRDVACPPESG